MACKMFNFILYFYRNLNNSRQHLVKKTKRGYMSSLKRIVVAVFLMATSLTASTAQADERAQKQTNLQPKASVSSNGVVYSATALIDVQQVVMGWAADGSTFACYVNRDFAGNYSLSADGAIGTLISDAQLPGGQTLANPTNGNFVQTGCGRDANNITTVFFMAVDPNHRLSNGSPFLSVWFADSNGRSGQILTSGNTFTAKDPRTKTDAVFTITQLSGLEVRKGKVTTLAVVTPPQQSTGVPPVPQGMF